jgi:hypothetical protein
LTEAKIRYVTRYTMLTERVSALRASRSILISMYSENKLLLIEAKISQMTRYSMLTERVSALRARRSILRTV